MAGGVVKKDKPSNKEVSDFHTNADTDGSRKAIHHTLGAQPNQAAAGNHSHDGGDSTLLFPLEGYTITGSSTTGDLAFRNSVIAALVKLGAQNGTT